jgi:transposase
VVDGLPEKRQERGGIAAALSGRSQVRTVLYMCTVAALRRNPVIRAFYQRLRTGGKPGTLQ